MALSWLENLTKPVAERIGDWLARRRPYLYVHPVLGESVWCIASPPGSKVASAECMQVSFSAALMHDNNEETLIITQAYPAGTKLQVDATGQFTIPPRTMVRKQIAAFVLPIKAKRGQPWTARFVLVDHLHRKYKTKNIAFRSISADALRFYLNDR